MDLNELKLYLRVDGTDEDTLISSLQLGAEIYLTNTGITKDYTNDLYTLVVRLLANHWYSNRETFVNLRTAKIDFSIQCIINSLRYNQIPVVII
ncbi:MAG TPA: head-tail connector protein [Clostridium sp.]